MTKCFPFQRFQAKYFKYKIYEWWLGAIRCHVASCPVSGAPPELGTLPHYRILETFGSKMGNKAINTR